MSRRFQSLFILFKLYHSIVGRLRAYGGSACGNTAVVFALAVPAMLAVGGASIDLLQITRVKSKIQSVADNAAIATAKELSLASATTGALKALAAEHINAAPVDGISNTSFDVGVDMKNGEITVDVQATWSPTFAAVVGLGDITVKSYAKAKLVSKTASICVLSLRGSSSRGVAMQGTSTIDAPNCGVFANSNHQAAIDLTGNSTIRASVTCSAGGVNKSVGSSVQPTELTDCPVVPDPLAGRAAPAAGPCLQTNLSLMSGNHVLTPGVYCQGLKIGGTARVTFQPGDYTIDGGNLEFIGGSSSTGKDVGFFLTGNATALSCMNDAELRLSGRESGPMVGLLFFEDPSGLPGRLHRINCSNADELVGTIYMPDGVLLIDPNADVAADSAFTAIIAYEVLLGNNPRLVLNTNYNATDVPLFDGAVIEGMAVLAE